MSSKPEPTQSISSGEIDSLTPLRARRRPGQRMTKAERQIAQDTFIKALENTANVRAACMQAGISHAIVYQWQEHDTAFGIRFKEANKNANWLLFAEAWSRAMTGEKRYVVSRGELVKNDAGEPVTYREKSDRLLELLLKARLPEFRDKSSIDLNATHTSAAETAALQQTILAALSDYPDAKAVVAQALMDKARERGGG